MTDKPREFLYIGTYCTPAGERLAILEPRPDFEYKTKLIEYAAYDALKAELEAKLEKYKKYADENAKAANEANVRSAKAEAENDELFTEVMSLRLQKDPDIVDGVKDVVIAALKNTETRVRADRDKIREERDAALAEVERLKNSKPPTAAQVKEYREKHGVGLLAAKAALEQSEYTKIVLERDRLSAIAEKLAETLEFLIEEGQLVHSNALEEYRALNRKK